MDTRTNGNGVGTTENNRRQDDMTTKTTENGRRRDSMNNRTTIFFGILTFLLLPLAAQASVIAVNFEINRTTAVDDTAGGGYYWSPFGDAGASPTVFRPLFSALDGSATAFEMSATDNARISSTLNGSSSLITLDGVRLPTGVTNRGLGGMDGSVGDALTAWRIRVPTASIAFNAWELQMWVGDSRGGGLSPSAANVGGTFSFSSGTGSFSGGTTAFFGDPAGDPTNAGVDFVRTATMSVFPTIQTIDGTEYYVLDLQLGDLGRANSGTADYTSMVGMVLTIIPEPASFVLLGLAGLAALRRRR